ncbi:hypothetical protein QP922_02660 [Corynebacterium sp. MSK218]|uniref:hypothetical protein n=1 Tax=Corynebacterium sp. MSK218 TaxID=3050218 RepID=UPI00254CEE9E|nr:hypothetical protein [Corynebacterium sp. MSK218]MDK8762726.1 hypothetical protein [Corynebacterium sp. MSK218]
MQRWVWRDGALVNEEGETVARVTPTGLLIPGQPAITFEHTLGARRFAVRGPSFSAEQAGFTVNTLRAVCEGREYTLERTNPFRRERRIRDNSGNDVARTTPRGRDLEVAVGDLPASDAAFTSYCCLLLDGSTRPLRT